MGKDDSLLCLIKPKEEEMKNEKMESFLVLFYILDQCYEMCQENDLGGFLGMISPEMLEDGKPVDTAVYVDWKSFCTNGGKCEKLC